MILAIPAEAEATPPKPNNAATNAITRKITIHLNIIQVFVIVCISYL